MFVIVRTCYEGYEDVLAVTQDESQAKKAVEWIDDTSIIEVPEVTGFYEAYRAYWRSGDSRIDTIKTLSLKEEICEYTGCKVAIVATRERAEELLVQWTKESKNA